MKTNITHYYVRATYRVINKSIKKFIITACGYRSDKTNTTIDKEKVTCRACLHTVRMGKLVEY